MGDGAPDCGSQSFWVIVQSGMRQWRATSMTSFRKSSSCAIMVTCGVWRERRRVLARSLTKSLCETGLLDAAKLNEVRGPAAPITRGDSKTSRGYGPNVARGWQVRGILEGRSARQSSLQSLTDRLPAASCSWRNGATAYTRPVERDSGTSAGVPWRLYQDKHRS